MSNSSSRHIFDVLRFVSVAKEPVSVTAASQALGLPTTTAYRALATLEQAGYVARFQASTRYTLGPMVPGLFEAFLARFSLRDLATPYMSTLALVTGESVSLMAPVGWYGVRIALVRGMKEVIHTGPLGEVRPLTDGIASRAILATYSDAQIGLMLDTLAPHPSKKERDELRRDIAWIREHGYARGEMPVTRGLAAVALPLRGSDSVALGSIAIEGPVVDMKSRDPLPADWLRIAAEIEARVRADPEQFKNHYAHVDPRTIAFSLPRS